MTLSTAAAFMASSYSADDTADELLMLQHLLSAPAGGRGANAAPVLSAASASVMDAHRNSEDSLLDESALESFLLVTGVSLAQLRSMETSLMPTFLSSSSGSAPAQQTQPQSEWVRRWADMDCDTKLNALGLPEMHFLLLQCGETPLSVRQATRQQKRGRVAQLMQLLQPAYRWHCEQQAQKQLQGDAVTETERQMLHTQVEEMLRGGRAGVSASSSSAHPLPALNDRPEGGEMDAEGRMSLRSIANLCVVRSKGVSTKMVREAVERSVWLMLEPVAQSASSGSSSSANLLARTCRVHELRGNEFGLLRADEAEIGALTIEAVQGSSTCWISSLMGTVLRRWASQPSLVIRAIRLSTALFLSDLNHAPILVAPQDQKLRVLEFAILRNCARPRKQALQSVVSHPAQLAAVLPSSAAALDDAASSMFIRSARWGSASGWTVMTDALRSIVRQLLERHALRSFNGASLWPVGDWTLRGIATGTGASGTDVLQVEWSDGTSSTHPRNFTMKWPEPIQAAFNNFSTVPIWTQGQRPTKEMSRRVKHPPAGMHSFRGSPLPASFAELQAHAAAMLPVQPATQPAYVPTFVPHPQAQAWPASPPSGWTNPNTASSSFSSSAAGFGSSAFGGGGGGTGGTQSSALAVVFGGFGGPSSSSSSSSTHSAAMSGFSFGSGGGTSSGNVGGGAFTFGSSPLPSPENQFSKGSAAGDHSHPSSSHASSTLFLAGIGKDVFGGGLPGTGFGRVNQMSATAGVPTVGASASASVASLQQGQQQHHHHQQQQPQLQASSFGVPSAFAAPSGLPPSFGGSVLPLYQAPFGSTGGGSPAAARVMQMQQQQQQFQLQSQQVGMPSAFAAQVGPSVPAFAADYSAYQRQDEEQKRKDPNAPKSPLTAYMIFNNVKRELVKQQNPGIAFDQIDKVIFDMWQFTSSAETHHFIALAEKDKKRYESEMAEYRARGGASDGTCLVQFGASTAGFSLQQLQEQQLQSMGQQPQIATAFDGFKAAGALLTPAPLSDVCSILPFDTKRDPCSNPIYAYTSTVNDCSPVQTKYLHFIPARPSHADADRQFAVQSSCSFSVHIVSMTPFHRLSIGFRQNSIFAKTHLLQFALQAEGSSAQAPVGHGDLVGLWNPRHLRNGIVPALEEAARFEGDGEDVDDAAASPTAVQDPFLHPSAALSLAQRTVDPGLAGAFIWSVYVDESGIAWSARLRGERLSADGAAHYLQLLRRNWENDDAPNWDHDDDDSTILLHWFTPLPHRQVGVCTVSYGHDSEARAAFGQYYRMYTGRQWGTSVIGSQEPEPLAVDELHPPISQSREWKQTLGASSSSSSSSSSLEDSRSSAVVKPEPSARTISLPPLTIGSILTCKYDEVRSEIRFAVNGAELPDATIRNVLTKHAQPAGWDVSPLHAMLPIMLLRGSGIKIECVREEEGTKVSKQKADSSAASVLSSLHQMDSPESAAVSSSFAAPLEDLSAALSTWSASDRSQNAASSSERDAHADELIPCAASSIPGVLRMLLHDWQICHAVGLPYISISLIDTIADYIQFNPPRSGTRGFGWMRFWASMLRPLRSSAAQFGYAAAEGTVTEQFQSVFPFTSLVTRAPQGRPLSALPPSLVDSEHTTPDNPSFCVYHDCIMSGIRSRQYTRPDHGRRGGFGQSFSQSELVPASTDPEGYPQMWVRFAEKHPDQLRMEDYAAAERAREEDGRMYVDAAGDSSSSSSSFDLHSSYSSAAAAARPLSSFFGGGVALDEDGRWLGTVDFSHKVAGEGFHVPNTLRFQGGANVAASAAVVAATAAAASASAVGFNVSMVNSSFSSSDSTFRLPLRNQDPYF